MPRKSLHSVARSLMTQAHNFPNTRTNLTRQGGEEHIRATAVAESDDPIEPEGQHRAPSSSSASPMEVQQDPPSAPASSSSAWTVREKMAASTGRDDDLGIPLATIAVRGADENLTEALDVMTRKRKIARLDEEEVGSGSQYTHTTFPS